jgi:ferredoxin
VITMLKVRDGYDPSISIEISEKCIACGACAQVCPIGTISYELGSSKSRKPIITDPSVCFSCGQCIAVCPKDAISHNKLLASDFPKIENQAQISWDAFVGLTRQRRSIRKFEKTPVPKEIIAKILDESTKYAPTGMNRQAVELMIIDGERLVAIREEMNAVLLHLYNLLKHTHWLSQELELHWRHMQVMKRMIELEMDPSTRNAPLMLLFITDNRVKENETDATILSYQTLLSAEILGLKTCYFGAIQNSLPFSRKLKRILNLPSHRMVACGLLLGYANIKYRKMVSRKPLKAIE